MTRQTLLRILSGMASLVLFLAYIALNVWAVFLVFFCGVVSLIALKPMRTRTLAGFGALFALLDWRPLILRLVRKALDG